MRNQERYMHCVIRRYQFVVSNSRRSCLLTLISTMPHPCDLENFPAQIPSFKNAADIVISRRNAHFDQVLFSLTDPQVPSQGGVLLIGESDEILSLSTLTALHKCAFESRVMRRTQRYLL